MGTMRLLHQGMEQAAFRSPDKIYVVVEDVEYDYSQLEDSSSRLAQALLNRGLHVGDRVAIYMDNTWPCVVAVYAALRAGCIFMVINPQTKADKLRYILNDSEAKVLLSDKHLEGVFGPVVDECPSLTHLICSGEELKSTASKLSYEQYENVINKSARLDFVVDTIPSDPCAMIYTSGSTGNPKGVLHTHQSMVFALGSITEYLRLDDTVRILNVLPFAFDYGLYQMLMTAWLGATLVLERSFTYPAQIFNRIHEHHVTVFPGVPTIFNMLIAAHERTALCFPTVTRVTNTAATLSPNLIPALMQIFPNALIYKMYGLTECKRVSYLEPEKIDSHSSSVGKAIPGTQVFLLTSEGKPVGRPGEGILHVRGPHIMSCYWRLPELTDQMIKPGLFPGDRVLCTHDWFRMDNEGYLYFLGRSDDIIKCRGEKVSPVEVEGALLSIDGIHEAAVFGIKDDLLGQAVIACVSLSDPSLSTRKIKMLCMGLLENFMVPKDVVIMDSLPKSGNGKIDKKLLSENYKSCLT